MEVVTGSWSLSRSDQELLTNHVKNMTSCVMGHLADQYRQLCSKGGRPFSERELRIFQKFDADLKVAKTMGLGMKGGHQGGIQLPNAIVRLHNVNIEKKKPLGAGVHGSVYSCYVREIIGFDPTILYTVKEYKENNVVLTMEKRDREILAARTQHFGVVRAIGFSIDDTTVAIFPYWNGGSLYSFSELVRISMDTTKNISMKSLARQTRSSNTTDNTVDPQSASHDLVTIASPIPTDIDHENTVNALQARTSDLEDHLLFHDSKMNAAQSHSPVPSDEPTLHTPSQNICDTSSRDQHPDTITPIPTVSEEDSNFRASLILKRKVIDPTPSISRKLTFTPEKHSPIVVSIDNLEYAHRNDIFQGLILNIYGNPDPQDNKSCFLMFDM
ncbi:hypothetical protein R1sor_025195 [Riccia sorocarpa]|uniref:Uncharacterized protein n=1 Tax=Riccia sorocarpa TaxID=122646 RepID=A0ABD3GAN8_9MARC